MKLVLPSLIASAYAATTLTNVACNGKDKITFTLTKDAGSSLGAMQTLGCANADGALDSSVYTQNGDVYNFDFNPYTTCMGAPDPNDAATYSVDFKILMSNSVTVGGQTMYFSGDQVDLKCTFQSTYTLTSDLGGVNLEGDQLIGDEFALDFEMVRTQDDYSGVDSSTVVANELLYHRITSTTVANLGATDFAFSPSLIRVEKKNSNPLVSFDLWNKDMSSCGHSEVDFEMDYDDSAKQWTFKYRAFLLDTEQGQDYQIIAVMELCNSLNNDLKCTAATDQCATPPIVYTPDNNSLVTALWRSGNSLTTDIGESEFNRLFGLCPVVVNYRATYVRTTAIPADFNAYRIFGHSFTAEPSNAMNVDFKVYGNLNDAINDNNSWNFCDMQGGYNGEITGDIHGFPANCGPNGAIGGYQFFTMPQYNRPIANSNQGMKIWYGDNCPSSIRA